MKKLNAKPNINGNSVEDFQKVYDAIMAAEQAAEGVVNRMSGDVVHGRNYQHLRDPMEVYVAKMEDKEMIMDAVKAKELMHELRAVFANAIWEHKYN